MEDFQSIVAESKAPKTDVNMDLVTAIGKLVDKCNQVSTDVPSYRKTETIFRTETCTPR